MFPVARVSLLFCHTPPLQKRSQAVGHRQKSSYSNRNPHLHACTHLDSSQSPSPLQPITFRGKLIYIKRDDTLTYNGVTGNKLRKFHFLMQPDALENVDTVVSYGGAQSNAMLAMSSLCSKHRKRFVYITRATSKTLSSIPGNYRSALEAGMEHIQLTNENFRNSFVDRTPGESRTAASTFLLRSGLISSSSRLCFIPQGGACKEAEEGIRILSNELLAQLSHLREHGRLKGKRPILFLAGGTGTTAFYLQKHLKDAVRVVAIPVAGDERYLLKQMRLLQSCSAVKHNDLNAPRMPDVIRPRDRSTFADVTAKKLSIWKELTRATNGEITFDLIYAPKAWEEAMLAVAENRFGSGGEDLLYYHSGGIEGNQSMLGKHNISHLLRTTQFLFAQRRCFRKQDISFKVLFEVRRVPVVHKLTKYLQLFVDRFRSKGLLDTPWGVPLP